MLLLHYLALPGSLLHADCPPSLPFGPKRALCWGMVGRLLCGEVEAEEGDGGV